MLKSSYDDLTGIFTEAIYGLLGMVEVNHDCIPDMEEFSRIIDECGEQITAYEREISFGLEYQSLNIVFLTGGFDVKKKLNDPFVRLVRASNMVNVSRTGDEEIRVLFEIRDPLVKRE